MNAWFYAWLGTLVVLGVGYYIADRGWARALEIAGDALAGWQRCEDHWRATIDELEHAEERIADLTQGDEWKRT